jgi:hypothetical protein
MTAMKDFEEYIEWRVNGNQELQKSLVTDRHGDSIVDYVGKFESIEDDFKEVCKRVGVSATLPHINRTIGRKSYHEYYSPKSKELVDKHFKEDIEMFGYSFE